MGWVMGRMDGRLGTLSFVVAWLGVGFVLEGVKRGRGRREVEIGERRDERYGGVGEE